MKQLARIILFLILGFAFSSCGGDEIDACVGAASDPVTYDIDCDDCCRDNGYKRGVITTSSSAGTTTTRKCKCSGDAD
ncbi:hypothetical protein SAMN05661096_03740 [Marivirga sericea]|uniref:Lipoprotein n=1 Tax=Marivirga sericea TaxID=1028 RepID=A0A1X7LAD1_9BACT|nr:hypothetical protein [Marivirga sericea]SMG50791.1 hypothetical protein SAMN05661096_03740 [Marivirga sericea]